MLSVSFLLSRVFHKDVAVLSVVLIPSSWLFHIASMSTFVEVPSSFFRVVRGCIVLCCVVFIVIDFCRTNRYLEFDLIGAVRFGRDDVMSRILGKENKKAKLRCLQKPV